MTPPGGEIINRYFIRHRKEKERTSASTFFQDRMASTFLLPFRFLNSIAMMEMATEMPPERLLKEVLKSIQDGSLFHKLQGIPMERLLYYVNQYYVLFRKNTRETHNLELAKAFANLVYLLNPQYSNKDFSYVFDGVDHAWLEYIPKSIKAVRSTKAIPVQIMERFAIAGIKNGEGTVGASKVLPIAKPVEPQSEEDYEFDEEELKKVKYKYITAEFCFVLRDYQTTQQYLKKVLDTPYLNVDARNLMIQNSILWSESQMNRENYSNALGILKQVDLKNVDKSTEELLEDKIKEATVLHRLIELENKCPLNERHVGPFLRGKIGYRNFLKLTYSIFENIDFHQRLEKIRAYPKKMIYPLLERRSTPKIEELIEKRQDRHDKLIRELYDWFWNLDTVVSYLPPNIKHELTVKFGEYGSGPVIYFRYISKGQYANIIISKAAALANHGKIQDAKKVLFQTYELTGSEKIKNYLDFLRRHSKAKKAIRSKKDKTVKKKITVVKKGNNPTLTK